MDAPVKPKVLRIKYNAHLSPNDPPAVRRDKILRMILARAIELEMFCEKGEFDGTDFEVVIPGVTTEQAEVIIRWVGDHKYNESGKRYFVQVAKQTKVHRALWKLTPKGRIVAEEIAAERKKVRDCSALSQRRRFAKLRRGEKCRAYTKSKRTTTGAVSGDTVAGSTTG